MGKVYSSKKISKKLHCSYICKYYIAALIFADILTFIFSIYGLLTGSLTTKQAIAYLLWFCGIIIGLFIFYILSRNSDYFLTMIDGEENLDAYLESIKDIQFEQEYREAIEWFSTYILITSIKDNGSEEISLLHELTKKDGLCPAADHMKKFQNLCRILLTEQYSNSPSDFDDEINEIKKAILNGDKENLVVVRKLKDKNIAVYVIVGTVQVLGALISGIQGDDLSSFADSYNFVTFISNMCFYFPLVVLNILLYKGIVRDRATRAEIEGADKTDIYNKQ